MDYICTTLGFGTTQRPNCAVFPATDITFPMLLMHSTGQTSKGAIIELFPQSTQPLSHPGCREVSVSLLEIQAIKLISVPQPFYWSWYLPLKTKYGECILRFSKQPAHMYFTRTYFPSPLAEGRPRRCERSQDRRGVGEFILFIVAFPSSRQYVLVRS